MTERLMVDGPKNGMKMMERRCQRQVLRASLLAALDSLVRMLFANRHSREGGNPVFVPVSRLHQRNNQK